MAEINKEIVESDEVTLLQTERNLEDPGAGVNERRSKRTSMKKLYFRRFMRNKVAVVGVFILLALILFAIIGPWVTEWNWEDPDFMALGEPPSAEHWFGTQIAGYDLFAQCAHAVGRSLTIGFSVAIATTLISAIVGTATAYAGALGPRGRWLEKAMLSVINFLLIMPAFLIIGLIITGKGGSWQLLILVLIIFGWMGSARVIWSLSMSLREREFVTAARYMGVPGIKILWRHMVPNIGSLLVIQMTLGVQSTVMAETSFSFLGLGLKAPDVSLGSLLSIGSDSLVSSPWLFYFPAGILTMITLAAAFVADGLRDALDPNSQAGGKA
ncbi:peptide ABC transporter permease [Boudabousia liubingyangii]|uniref:Oligopeptide transport system permease protein OppC n=1 Tax=Boudabousia liubingyangii TaxID=1921764 RepID=A0A1Q5PKZ5_9ACTO|nr:ABC transporter permease [Boudabousia liubingyangii]OKL46371.1 peptide ABC transporter permease [Boudabousia liubingyangii]OKL47306.1 peptide ABC transporter permease [Boudabousia liubingyangii]